MTINKGYRADGGDIGTGRLKEIADNPYGDEEKCWLAKRVLALLDELEAAEKLIAEFDQRIRTQNRHACELFDEAKAQRQRTAELEASHAKLRESMAAIHNTIRLDGAQTSLAVILGAAKRAHDESAAAAGVSIKWES